MRKLTSSECTVLLGLMAIGSHANAQEVEELPVTSMDTVQVYAYYQLPPNWDSYDELVPIPLAGISLSPTPSNATRSHIAACVSAYSEKPVKSNFPINYRAYYAWLSPGPLDAFVATPTSTPPSSAPGWQAIQGDTKIPTAGSGGYINVYALGYVSTDAMFQTVAHEEAHAHGEESEDVAENIAMTAYNAWKADGGAKCGGL